MHVHAVGKWVSVGQTHTVGCHKRTLLSLEPDAISACVGEKATEYTAACHTAGSDTEMIIDGVRNRTGEHLDQQQQPTRCTDT